MVDPFVPPAEVGSVSDGLAALAMGQDTPGIAEWLEELIWTRAARSPRSLQRTVGPSGLGTDCDRQLAHALAGTPPVNHTADPWAAIVGTAVHAWLAQLFTALDGGSGRYLIEHAMTYRGITGTLDLYDRRRRMLIDWKTLKLDRLKHIRQNGPPPSHVIQTQVYAAGLTEAGEDPARVAIVYLPVDGRLSDLYVWATDVVPEVAEGAVARAQALAQVAPAEATPTPSRLCPWCDHYRAHAQDLSVACPGPTP
ncbi:MULTISPECIES: PD-(D/E)XK nuclease family protein [unclassified Nocardiopsis]|uniref:PD-(D/E)XK nuclease family protein n=1 Tax=unclassified Nocardiopsis TaxID=2649073 RepID=UPI00135A92FD|nr:MULTISPECIES: PD-(D/E)XK nuclease family protein [unclassified Nocardiopsis]